MKINDIVLEQQINEFIDLKDFGTFIKSVMTNVNNPQFNWQDVKEKAMQDRAVQLAARAFLNKWKKIRWNVYREYGEKTRESNLRDFLRRLSVNEIGANPSRDSVIRAMQELLNLEDQLNNNAAISAATSIITSGVAQAMRDKDVEPDTEDQSTTASKQVNQMQYGSRIPDAFRNQKENQWINNLIPVVISWGDNEGKPGNELRYVKYDGEWYLDPNSIPGRKRNPNQIVIDPALHVQKAFQKNLEKGQEVEFALEIRLRKFFDPAQTGQTSTHMIELVGLQRTSNPQEFILPDDQAQAAWKQRTGRNR